MTMPAGYRKFAVAVLALTYGFILGLFGKLTAEFATIVSITVAAFTAANYLSKRAPRPNNASQEN